MRGIKWVHNKKILLIMFVVFLVLCNIGSKYFDLFAKFDEILVIDGSDGVKKYMDDKLEVNAASNQISWSISYKVDDMDSWEELMDCYITLYNENGKLIFDNYPGSEINEEDIMFEGVGRTGQGGIVSLSGSMSNLKESTVYKMELYVKSKYKKGEERIEYRKYADSKGDDKIVMQTLKRSVGINDFSINLDEAFNTTTTFDEVSGKHSRVSFVDGYFYGSGIYNAVDINDPNVGIVEYMFNILDNNNEKDNYVINGNVNDPMGYWKNISINNENDSEHKFNFYFSKLSEISLDNSNLDEKLELCNTLCLHPNTNYLSRINFRNDINSEATSGLKVRNFITKPDISEWYLKQGNMEKDFPDASFASGASTYGCFYPYTMNERNECVSNVTGANITGMVVGVYKHENLSEENLFATYELNRSDQESLNSNEYNNMGFKLNIDNLEPNTTYYVKYSVSNDGGNTVINGGEFTTDSLVQVVYVDSEWKEDHEQGKVNFSPSTSLFAAKRDSTFEYKAEIFSNKPYIPKYYKVNGKDDFVEKVALDNLTYKIEKIESTKNIVYVQYLSTLLSVELPAKIDFVASSSKPLDSNVTSSDTFDYKITNHSELPIKILFKSLNVNENESDNIHFVSSFQGDNDQMKLSLLTKNDVTNGLKKDYGFNENNLFPEKNGIGIEANYEYNYEIGCLDGAYESVHMPPKDESLRTWAFKIVGSYNGKFYTISKKPKVNFSFHFDLLLD